MFKGTKDKLPELKLLTIDELADLLQCRESRADKEGPAFSPVVLKRGSTRKAANVETVSMLVVDLDGADYESVRAQCERFAHIAYTTHSHMSEKGPRWRLVFPLARDVAGSEWRDFYERASTHAVGSGWDPACRDACRLHFLPSSPPDRMHLARFLNRPGTLLDPESIPPLEPKETAAAGQNGSGSLKEVLTGNLHDGRKHEQVRDFIFAQRERGRLLEEVQLMLEGAIRKLPASRLGGKSHDQVVAEYQNDAAKLWGSGQRVRPAESTRSPTTLEWGEPQPLICESDESTYPSVALPPIIADAVKEAVEFVQCPFALAACSAWSAMSLVGQALIDVRREIGLEGPVSLYVLAVADSGERKTTCDNLFLQGIRAWEQEQYDRLGPALRQFKAEQRAWKAKTEGLEGKIKQEAQRGKQTADSELALQAACEAEPMQPDVPRLVYNDATPEALGRGLSQWPSAGLMSNEGGLVLGGQAMGKDSVMRFLAMLNTFWDGQPVRVDRKTTESYYLQGTRLTVGLAVQPDTFATFLEQDRGLARGTGFLARFLVAHPASTQGSRMFRDNPGGLPGLARFHSRLRELLDLQTELGPDRTVQREMLELSAEAKKTWVKFHDDVERELGDGGGLRDVRDVASKAADNAGRIAGLFHLVQCGPHGNISADTMTRACEIVAWHVSEAKRFYGATAVPKEVRTAQLLEQWLSRRPSGEATIRELQHKGPNAVRTRAALDESIRMLVEAGRVRTYGQPKPNLLKLHPSLVMENHAVL